MFKYIELDFVGHMLAFIYISGIRLNIVKGAKSNFMQIYAALLNTEVQF